MKKSKDSLLYVFNEISRVNKYVILYYAVFVVLSVADAYILKFFGEALLDSIAAERRITYIIFITAGSFLGAMLTAYLKNYFCQIKTPEIIKITQGISRRVAQKNLTEDYERTEDPDFLDSQEKAYVCLNSIDKGFQGMIHSFFSAAESVLFILVYIIVVGFSDMEIVFVTVILAAAGYLLSGYAGAYEHKMTDEQISHKRKGDYYFSELSDFKSGKDMRIFSFFSLIFDRFKESRNAEINTRKYILKRYLLMDILGLLCNGLGTFGVYFFVINSFVSGKITIGRFSLIIAAATQSIGMLKNLAAQTAKISVNSKYIQDLKEFLNMDGGDGKSHPDCENFEITLENVWFRYKGCQDYIFEDFSMTIHPGEKLALVGFNGAGKTTLIKLVCGLLKPEKGRICLNGTDINTIDKKDYFPYISSVFQELCIFAFSAAENITLKENYENTEEVNDYLKKVGLFEKIQTLELKERTPMSKKLDKYGVELSGGEGQRLVFARALYKNGSVMILDEPTSALDPIAEKNLYETFDKNVLNQTCIYISHRISFAVLCDKIAFLEKGKVVEYGSHRELLDRNGKYAEFYNMQAGYYNQVDAK